ncbi:DUF3151 domain-containing protein [Canibacter zhoujuaniae]|uniref:DUF3151 domain-containing protein n=1 Tax=Canibacter zhoujuaniae TaxID=2708343 RepID=UPI00142080B8|nr:DUF3151 domain-containing protein [Canibacter zhoujuaniae]
MVENLLAPEPTLLPDEPEVRDALAAVTGDDAARLSAVAKVVQQHPESSLAWAELANLAAVAGDDLNAYAYSRIGYHRGLDALRKNGWGGVRQVPWRHEPNRGVLLAFYALARSAAKISEQGEPARLVKLLEDSDSAAIAAIEAALKEQGYPLLTAADAA